MQWNYKEELNKRFPIKEGYRYCVYDKKNEKYITDDYLNESGCIIRYLRKEYNLEIPSSFKRISYFKSNGTLWYEQFIQIKEEPVKRAKKCPYCDWETYDIENKSGAFLDHLKTMHNISKEEHLKLHPEDREYLKLANKTLDRQNETDEAKYVVCKICGKKLARIDWRHLSKHNITREEYIAKYGDEIVSQELHNKCSKIAKKENENIIPKYTSVPEKEIMNFIKSLGLSCRKDRSILNGKEIDIYIPEKKIGIEYNGLIWHSEYGGGKSPSFHLEKTRECEKKGIRLIHIFEDEYLYNKEIVENKLKYILKVDNNLPKIMARKCIVKEISKDDFKKFLNQFHIQGECDCKINIGGFFEDKLVGVMGFRNTSKGKDYWELSRFATDYNYICQGLGGKLFNYFVKNYNPLEIKSFADRRWSINEVENLYKKLGFEFYGYTQPSYWYFYRKIHAMKRIHKFNFRKQHLHRRYGLPLSMTEKEMTQKLGYDRIWDCGLIKYVWKRK